MAIGKQELFDVRRFKIKKISSKLRGKFTDLFTNKAQKLSGIEYWQYRARKLGKLAVFNIGHSKAETEAVLANQKAEIYPHFRDALRGDEKVILDLGCGSGRFTNDLANIIGGKAIGVDPIESLIDLAPLAQNTEYKVMEEAKIPIPDKSVDVVWVYGVLGCIFGNTIDATISEIDRALKDDGLLFLLEGVDGKSSKSYVIRNFDWYKKQLSFAPLSYVHDYLDCITRFAVMKGRKGLQGSHT